MAIGQSDGSIILSTKVDTKGIKQGTNSIMAMATKAGSALAVAFSVKKIADFVKASVDAFAEYEQLVGGVETLFKKSADKVMKYANEAYRTSGMSANEYMANVTSFSASLLSSLEGDTDKAAEVANAALISISDNANKMGSSLESVTMAFQGFAKQQYQLLDNLKLGYGGTKGEMERLLKDAQAITDVEYNIDNLADVYTAIGVIQEKLGIAGTTAKEAATTISGAAGMMRASWQNVLVAISGGGDMDAAIENLANSVDIYFDNILPVVEKAIRGIGIMIEKIAPKLAETVGRAFIAEIPRLTTSIYAMIVGAFKGLYQGIVALFKKETNAMLEEQAEKTEETAKNQEKVTDNVKETNKELKKTLAGFDDIQILSSGIAEEEPITPQTISGGADVAADMTIDGSPYVEEVDETLNAIMAIVSPCLIAVGLILLFAGNIGWGAGFIIAGATTVGAVIANSQGTDTQSGVIQMLTTIMGVAGGALLALGIILVYFKVLPMGIGMIVAGASLIVSSVASQGIFNPNDIASWLSIIMGIAGGALLAIGIFLCYMKVYPQGIGLIIAGATSLISAVALGSEDITEKIKGWVAVIMAIVGAAVLVLGVILTVTGNLMIGIPLIALGAASLVTPIALNWNAIVDWVKGVFNSVIDWIKTYGLLVLGILLCLTGTGIPLGIALIIKWAKGGAKNGVPLAMTIVDKVKEAWAAVKSFWNKNVAMIFTVSFWERKFSAIGEGFKSVLSSIKIFFANAINWIIDGLNKISFDVPEWVPVIGGKTFGFDIKKINVPKLARGAVIPPNREFLAVLGDNKKENEIVSPVSTMKQAFMEAMIEMGGNFGGGNTEVVLEIDGREFGRAVVEQSEKENRRIGTRLVVI